MGRRVAALAVVATVGFALVACGSDTYPLPTMPPHAGQTAPAGIGEGIPGVVLFVEPRPGDSIEFISAEPIGSLDGAEVEFFFSPPILLPDGARSVGDRLEPLRGSIATTAAASPGASAGPLGYFGIVARITASRPGRFVLSNVRVRYRLNGGAERIGEGIDVVLTVCADDPKPTDCPVETTSP
jgi:hypothetical protein